MVKLLRMKGVRNIHKFTFWKIQSLLFLFFLSFTASSQDSTETGKNKKVTVGGYVKDLQSYYFINKPGSLTSGNLIHNRINFRWDITNNLYARIEARNRIFFGEQVKLTPGFGKIIDDDKGSVDLSYNLIEDTVIVLNAMLDRVLINWSKNKWEVTLGRQRINWGINLAWNPNDIFNAFNFFDFDYEERPGADALRIQYYSSSSTSLEVACKLSGNKNEQVAALMYKINAKRYDVQYFTGIYFKDLVAGAGWAGNIGKSGFKGEFSYFHPYENISDTTSNVSFAVSLDRTFKKDYFAMVSYLYNRKEKNQSNSIATLGGTVLSAKQLMPFKHSFLFQLGKSINSLIQVNYNMIYSPEKNSIIVLPSISGSLSNNWDLALVTQCFFADVNNVYRFVGNNIFLRICFSY